MPILFADLLEPKLNIPATPGGGTYWQELSLLVAAHDAVPRDWVALPGPHNITRRRQLDKYEPVLSYYLFAALNMATNAFADSGRLRTLFGAAFSSAAIVDALVAHCGDLGWPGLHFEALAHPSATIIEAVENESAFQPVGYIRELGEARRTDYEGDTVFDVLIGDRVRTYCGTAETCLGIEAKFTSDMSVGTKFSTHRNQIIRNIEVGNIRCTNFVFLLIAPKMYREHGSRFYAYKMNEYLGEHGAEALNYDSVTKPGLNVTARWRERIGWFDWEDVVRLLYPEGHAAFAHPDAGNLEMFLRQRLLWPWG
jgi:hypothetical protein